MSHCMRMMLLERSYLCHFSFARLLFNVYPCHVVQSHSCQAVVRQRSSYLCTSFLIIRNLQSQPGQTFGTREVDPNVTLYYQPSQVPININLTLIASDQAADIENGSLDIEICQELEKSALSVKKKSVGSLDSEHVELQSIEDMICREVQPHLDYAYLPAIYMKLSKVRLTGLVVVTAVAGYALAPGSFDTASFLLCCFGTGLISASANAINQFFEVPFDSQMTRTRTRPLVKGLLSPLHAVNFAVITGLTGTAVLACGINELTAVLGALNLLLYTAIYTPMKRLNIANTWLGSIVGAIPPLMGWAASAGTLHIGAIILGAIMYAWQFPHFCALSWNLRPDYSRAGYRMMSVINPGLCQRTALRYSVTLSSLCMLLPYFGITTWTFAVDSMPLNLCLVYLAWRFYQSGNSNSSRRLFHFSLIHIPALLLLMLISKKQFGNVAQSS